MGYIIMLLLISLLVILHEVGHMLVAQRCGVKVERFGLGLPFGPTLWEKQWKGIKWCLHAVPLGGYVSFPDDNSESDVPLDSPQRFENQPLPNQAAIAMAGITVNAIIAIVLMVLVHAVWGAQQSQLVVTGFSPVSITQPVPKNLTSLGQLGVYQRPYQTVDVNAMPVEWIQQAPMALAMYTPIENMVRFVGLHTGGAPQRFDIAPIANPDRVLITMMSSPAAAAGVQPGDAITHFEANGKEHVLTGYYSEPIQHLPQLLQKTAPGEPIQLKTAQLKNLEDPKIVSAPEHTYTLQQNPAKKLGIYMGLISNKVPLGFATNLKLSTDVLGNMVVQNFEGLGKLVTGQLSPDMLDGPVGVVKQGGQLIEKTGIQNGLWLTAVISIILAVMNLLPFPPLDGSYLIYIGYEAIFRKPFPMKAKQFLNMGGFFILMGLMLFVLGNDVVKLFK